MSTIHTHCGEFLLAYSVGCGSAQYIPPHHIEGVDWQKSYTFSSVSQGKDTKACLCMYDIRKQKLTQRLSSENTTTSKKEKRRKKSRGQKNVLNESENGEES